MTKEKIIMLLVKMFVSIAYLANFLITKPTGILVLVLLLHYFSSSFGLGNSYSFSELMLWIDQLSSNSKTSVITSIITISGFLVAFSINSAIQKQQLMSQMKIEASNDIESFFNEASRKLSSANIYAKYLLEIVDNINNNQDQGSIEFHLQNVIKETNKYTLLRKNLQEQAIEVHRFQSKYSVIFASSWGVMSKLDAAVEGFIEITDNLYFNTPMLRFDDPNIKETYIDQVNVDQCSDFITAYEKNYLVINEAIGGLRGVMLGSITGLNLSFLINFLKMDKNE